MRLSPREQVEQAVAPYRDARPLACTVSDDARITWLCSGCGEPIRPGTGSLTVPDKAALAWRQADDDAADLAAGSSALTGGPRVYVVEDYDPPPVPRWLAYHRACHPDTSSLEGLGPYGFTVDEIATPRQVMTCTAHLLGDETTKDWLPSTDWAHLIGVVVAAFD